MCCFLLVLGFLGPRLAFLWAWLFTPQVNLAFGGSFLWPLVGMLFLPWTALCYVFAWAPLGGVTGIGWLVVGLGFLLDIASYSSRAAQQRFQPESA